MRESLEYMLHLNQGVSHKRRQRIWETDAPVEDRQPGIPETKGKRHLGKVSAI